MFSNNLKFTLLVTIGMLMPDLYLGLFKNVISAGIPLSNLISIATFTLLLSFVKNKKLLWGLFALFAFMQLIQLNHWVYFGAPIHSQDIGKVFFEMDEIFATGVSMLSKVVEVWVVLIISLITIGYALKQQSNRLKNKIASILICLILAVTPLLSFIKGAGFFYTKPTATSVYNSLRAFSDWAVNSYTSFKGPNYESYKVAYQKPKTANIVVIMGESQSSRYMQLYGYPANNTPYLNGLKNDPNFAHCKGVSSSVYTRTCLQLFFNVIHNPGDVNNLRQKTANLFAIAKKQGYHTVVLSAQNEKLFHDTGTEFVDLLVFAKQMEKSLKAKGDLALVEKFKELPLKDRNFIVLHLRHIHSPFSDYAKFLPDEYKSTKNECNKNVEEYVNAIAYNDFWVKQAVSAILAKLPKNTVVIFTSDHGELIGERGLHGHNLMETEVADVPVWVFDTTAESSKWLSAKKACSHYDLGKHIADLMGASVENLNESKHEQFVHGSEFYTNYTYMPWQINVENIEFMTKRLVSEVKKICLILLRL
jgi:glucan phosphoethanolaminetransferase (alkaline phosphatase superfamily)